jgi:hypothetical protein
MTQEEFLERVETAIQSQSVNINALAETLTTVVHTMDRFVAGLQNRPTKRMFYLVIVLAVLALGFNYYQSVENGHTASSIESCVNPEGDCAKKGAQATANALLSIHCGEVTLINELALNNNLKPVAVPDFCKTEGATPPGN